MADLAALTVTIDTRGAAETQRQLASVASIGGQAERALGGVARAAPATNRALAETGRAAGLSSHSLTNLSFQLNDIATGLAMGQSPFMIMAQQGGQVYQILSMSPGGVGGGLKTLGQTLVGLITPARLALGALAAIGGAGFLLHRSWKSAELQVLVLSERIGESIEKVHQLERAAAMRGISFDEFAKGMAAFGDQVDRARMGAGELATLFRANGAAVGDITETLVRAADLIQNARSEAEKYRLIQQLGLPPTTEWVRLLGQGGDALRTAINEATKFGDAANEGMIRRAREFDSAWEGAIKNFSLRWRAAFVSVASGLSSFGDKLTDVARRAALQAGILKPADVLGAALRGEISGSRLTGTEAADIYGAVGIRGAKGTTTDPQAVLQQLSLERQLIGTLGQLATVEQQVRAREIELQLARLSGINITKEQEGAILALTRAQAEASRLSERSQLGLGGTGDQWRQAEREIQVLLDRRIISLNEVATVQAVYTRRVEDSVKAIELTKAALPGLKALELESASLRGNLDRLGTEISNSFGGAFAEFATGAKTGKDAIKEFEEQLVRSMLNMAVQMTIVKSIAVGLQSLLGGFVTPAPGAPLNILPGQYHSGGIVGSDTVSGRYVHPAYFEQAPRLHGGMMPGEYPAILQRGEGVFTPSQMRAMAMGQQPKFTVNVINNAGADISTGRPQQNADGSISLEVIVDRAVARSVVTPGSNINSALRDGMGVSNRLARR